MNPSLDTLVNFNDAEDGRSSMPTLDFALAPEPSRQQGVRFDASEIVRLWDADVDIRRVVSS